MVFDPGASRASRFARKRSTVMQTFDVPLIYVGEINQTYAIVVRDPSAQTTVQTYFRGRPTIRPVRSGPFKPLRVSRDDRWP